MSIDVREAGRGLLVLSEIYYPGWRATVNGQNAEIHRVDGALRGVVVPAGASKVELEYVPVSSYVGAGLSLGTILCIPLAWLFFRRRSPR